MRKTSLSLAALGAIIATAGVAQSPHVNDGRVTIRASSDTSTVSKSATTQSNKSGSSTSDFARGAWLRLRGTRRRRSGYGWTNAHQKRVALKARNVKRNRRK